MQAANLVSLTFLLFALVNGRRSVTSFPPPSFSRDAKRSSGTTFLPHVIASLQPFFSGTLLHEPSSPKVAIENTGRAVHSATFRDKLPLENLGIGTEVPKIRRPCRTKRRRCEGRFRFVRCVHRPGDLQRGKGRRQKFLS